MIDYAQFAKALYSGVFPPILVLGLYGNTIGIIVLCRQKAKTSSIILLLSVCVANLISVLYASFLVVRMNLKIYGVHSVLTDGAEFKNNFHAYFSNIPMTWIAFSTAVIAVERACVVSMPMRFHRFWTVRKMYFCVLIIYICGLLLPIPKYIEMENGSREDIQTAALIDTIVTRLVPVIVVLIGNVVTFTAFYRQSRKNTQLVRQMSDKRTVRHFQIRHGNQTNKITKSLTVVMVAFLSCVAPATIFQLVIIFEQLDVSFLREPETEADAIIAVMVCVEVFHCCINSFLYIFTYRDFKREFINLMCFKHRKSASIHKSFSSEKLTTSSQMSMSTRSNW